MKDSSRMWKASGWELIKLGGLNSAKDQAKLLQAEVKRRFQSVAY